MSRVQQALNDPTSPRLEVARAGSGRSRRGGGPRPDPRSIRTAPGPDPSSPVEKALAQLEASRTYLANAIDALIARLEPVLGVPLSVSGEGPDPTDAEPSSPLVASIRCRAEDLDRLRHRLNETAIRLEI